MSDSPKTRHKNNTPRLARPSRDRKSAMPVKQFLGIDRWAEKISLHHVAAVFAQYRHGLLVLDALGDHDQAHVVTQFDGRTNDHRIIAAFGHLHDETLVDLQLIDGHALELRERRVAGAEIV